MSEPIEFFAKIPTINGDKIVRAWRHDDMSSWMWHGGAFTLPFADVPRRSRRFVVSHIGTGGSVSYPLGSLTFKQASQIAFDLDSEVEGASQIMFAEGHDIVRPEPGSVNGWYGLPRDQAAAVINRYLIVAGKPPLPTKGTER